MKSTPNRNQTSIKREKIKADKEYRVKTWRVESMFWKNKKIFLDSSPHRQPAEKGGGGTSQNVPHIYSAGKYPVLAICVRTQNDFYLKGI